MIVKIMQPDFTFRDDRGSLLQLFHDGFKQVNVITSREGTRRGGHYHRENEEAFYIISGHLKVTLSLNDESEEHCFGPGTFFGIGPYVKHSFEFLEDTLLISMYSNGVEYMDGTKDIVAV